MHESCLRRKMCKIIYYLSISVVIEEPQKLENGRPTKGLTRGSSVYMAENIPNIPFQNFYSNQGENWGGPPKRGGGGDFGCSVTTFSAPKAPKNGNFWKFLGKIGLSGQFLAPQAPNFFFFFYKFRYFSEKSPNVVKVEAFIA